MDIIKPISLLLQALAEDPEFSVYPWSLLFLKFCHRESNLKDWAFVLIGSFSSVSDLHTC